MEPVTLGAIVLALGGPVTVGTAIYKYGQLNQRVADLEDEVDRLEIKVDANNEATSTLLTGLVAQLSNLEKEMIDRLARIETSLSSKNIG